MDFLLPPGASTEGIKYIRVQWVDLANHIKSRVIPISSFIALLRSSRPSITITKAAFGLVFTIVADEFGAVGEYLYVPDMSSYRRCAYAPGHAAVMGWFRHKTPVPGVDGALTLEVDLCPRTILRRVVDNAKSSGVDFLVGFETEFILLKETNPPVGANTYGWSHSTAIRTGFVESKILEEITDALLEAGIEVQMYHAELAPGQFEMVTGPLRPVQAADALIHTRETIYNIATKYGLTATLAPRVFGYTCGSASHVHMSVQTSQPSSTSNISPDLNQAEASFISGVLAHLPALTLLNYTIPQSYDRMQDGVWSGGTYVNWGTDNREAPLRLCNATTPASRNFELKTLDGVANPYIALAGILGAGLKGIQDKRELTIQDSGKGGEVKTAALMTEDERKQLGITERLPLDWEAARKNFASSTIIDEIFGKFFKKKFLDINKALKDSLTVDRTQEQEMTFLVENY